MMKYNTGRGFKVNLGNVALSKPLIDPSHAYINYIIPHNIDKSKMGDNLPVSSLGRKIQKFEKRLKNTWKDVYSTVFCEFLDTVDYASSNGQLQLKEFARGLLRKCGPLGIYGFPAEEIWKASEYNGNDPQETYSVMLAILWRLYHAHELMEEVKEKADAKDKAFSRGRKYNDNTISANWLKNDWNLREKQKEELNERDELYNSVTVFQLQLFIDTHIDLARYMIVRSCYADKNLFYADVDSMKDDIELIESPISPIRTYYPYPDRFFYCGNLPDFTTIVDQGNVSYTTRPNTEHLVSHLIHLVSSKQNNQKCSMRNFFEIIENYVITNPVIISFLRTITHLALLGNYPHADYRPCFARRIEICHAFDPDLDPKDITFMSWMKNNDMVIYTITKEVYIYTVELMYSMDIIMEDIFYWHEFKDACKKCFDYMRRCMDKDIDTSKVFASMEENKKRWIGMDPEIRKYIKEWSRFKWKHKKTGFVNLMMRCMSDYLNSKIVNRLSGNVQTSEKYIGEELSELIQQVTDVIHYKHAGYLNKVELTPLQMFGITEKGYQLITDIYYLYTMRENLIADNSIPVWLIHIHNNSERDFHIINCYMRSINRSRSTDEYVLSYRHVVNQAMAIRANKGLEPYEPLDEDDDLYYYCPTCMRWAHPFIVPNNDVKKKARPLNAQSIYAKGLQMCIWKPETNQIMCGRQYTSSSIKRLQRSGAYESDDKIKELSDAKLIRNHKETGNCDSHPLVPKHMLGIALELNNFHPMRKKKQDGRIWAICEVCAKLTQITISAFMSADITCQFHRKSIDTIVRLSADVITRIQLRRPPDDPLHAKRMATDMYNTSDLQACYYCGAKSLLVEGVTHHSVRVCMDNTPTREIKSVWICNSDYNILKQNSAMDLIITHTQLISNFKDTPEKSVNVIMRKRPKDGKYTPRVNPKSLIKTKY